MPWDAEPHRPYQGWVQMMGALVRDYRAGGKLSMVTTS